MSPEAITAILLGLSPVPDGTKHHNPIPRREDITKVIAEVCSSRSVPLFCAIDLDTIVYRESGGHRFTMARDGTIHETAGDCPGMPAGDRDCTRERGAKSCGPFQTPCVSTPPGMTALAQTRKAWEELERATLMCPLHPLWAYAAGKCIYSYTADVYEKISQAHALEIGP